MFAILAFFAHFKIPLLFFLVLSLDESRPLIGHSKEKRDIITAARRHGAAQHQCLRFHARRESSRKRCRLATGPLCLMGQFRALLREFRRRGPTINFYVTLRRDSRFVRSECFPLMLCLLAWHPSWRKQARLETRLVWFCCFLRLMSSRKESRSALSRLRDFRVELTAEVSERASTLHQQLKRETAGLHQRLEAQLGLMEPELSIHNYQRVLRTFYGFYAPVEASLVRLAAAGSPLGFPAADALRADRE